MEVITVDERSTKQKVKDAIEEGKQKVKKAVEKVWENRVTVVPATVAVLAALGSVIKGANKRKELKEEEVRRTRSFYDRSLGCYWETKRTPTMNEMLEIEARRNSGETYGEILRDMGLLKRVR